MTIPKINSHNSWSKLQEVWLGDVYPSSWYDHLAPAVRDVFYKLTEITQQDLNSIQKTLESFGVLVQRPYYDSIDNYIDHTDNLIKPQICPRDQFVTIGNTLHCHPAVFDQSAWQAPIQEYLKDPASSVQIQHNLFINGANVVRTGRDILIDTDVTNWEYNNEFPEYRVRLIQNGGHTDGCFAVLRPGLILANNYFADYDSTFPGWEIIMLNTPSYYKKTGTNHTPPYPNHNGKFWETTVGTNRTFNDHVVQHAQDWVGNYTETYFELNCLSIDESNVVMLAENHRLAEDLHRRGITVHWVPFRARSFWDGGVHCLTVDIRRQSTREDYFPERG